MSMTELEKLGRLSGVTTLSKLDAAIERTAEEELPRGHLGMSRIGMEDERHLWLEHRFCLDRPTESRIQRIFRLGHILETEIVRLLRQTNGLRVYDVKPDGTQYRYSYFGGHFAGSMDGGIIGLPEDPLRWHVLEIKTVNDSRFKDLEKKGVKEWSPEYFSQMIAYMSASGMERAFFIAYNKNTSKFYSEIVEADPMYADALKVKAERILTSNSPPESSYPNEQFYKCNFFNDDDRAVYWGKRTPKKPNCRNCRFVRFNLENGNVDCHHKTKPSAGEPQTVEQQWAGCRWHNWNSALVPAKVLDETDDGIQYEADSGMIFWNAPANSRDNGEHVYDSLEVAGLSSVQFQSDELVDNIRAEFGGRVEWSPFNVGPDDA